MKPTTVFRFHESEDKTPERYVINSGWVEDTRLYNFLATGQLTDDNKISEKQATNIINGLTMDITKLLEKAISIALEAHTGQVDKAGQPYILHPLRLMLKFQDEEEQIVAILHDVAEDSAMTLDTLKENGFSDNVINAIECLTKRDNEDYQHFINRVKNNQLARKIKIEDIRDNMDLKRLNSITDKDLERVTKYHKALNILLEE